MPSIVAFASAELIACMPLGTSREAAPANGAGYGYLHVFGVHVPALAAVFITAAVVLLACEIVHRAGGQRTKPPPMRRGYL